MNAELKAAGWAYNPHRLGLDWHRGERCAGDRYWTEEDAVAIHRAEQRAGKTLWPGDEDWPL